MAKQDPFLFIKTNLNLKYPLFIFIMVISSFGVRVRVGIKIRDSIVCEVLIEINKL